MTTNIRHGHCAHGDLSPTYRSWYAMRQRCYKSKRPRYVDWGGRGITVCERWQTFENFLADMGERPDGLSLDRIDNDGNYEPDNCRWATAEQQAANCRTVKPVVVNGETMTRLEAARRFGIRKDTLRDRLRRGMPIEIALTAPLRGKPKADASPINALHEKHDTED